MVACVYYYIRFDYISSELRIRVRLSFCRRRRYFHWQGSRLPHVSHINEQFNEHFIILLMKHNLHYNSNIMHPPHTQHVRFGWWEREASALVCDATHK